MPTTDKELVFANVMKEIREKGSSVAGNIFWINDNEIGGVVYSLGNTPKGLPEILIIPRSGDEDVVLSSMMKASPVVEQLLQRPLSDYVDVPFVRINKCLYYEVCSFTDEVISAAKSKLNLLNKLYGEDNYQLTILRERVDIN